jgi:hypothetical protein
MITTDLPAVCTFRLKGTFTLYRADERFAPEIGYAMSELGIANTWTADGDLLLRVAASNHGWREVKADSWFGLGQIQGDSSWYVQEHSPEEIEERYEPA